MVAGIDGSDYRKKPVEWMRQEATTSTPIQKPEEKGATGPSIFQGIINVQGNNCAGV